MPDISLCRNNECPSRDTCYRYRAKPSEFMQAYGDFKPKGEKCEAFTSIEGWDERRLIPVGTLRPKPFHEREARK